MNANELADDAKNISNAIEALEWVQKAVPILRQQQAEIEALKDFAIWMTGCGYDFCKHEYFIKCRDELLKGKAQEK